jgi:ribonuclease Z
MSAIGTKRTFQDQRPLWGKSGHHADKMTTFLAGHLLEAPMIRPTLVLVVCAWILSAIFGPSIAKAAPCMIVTLTGTMGGPPEYNGLAGPGTLVRYGDDSNNCAALKLQFDSGRGTTMRLSQLNVPPAQINAVFFTHMHSDHVDGFADLMQLRWHFDSKAPKVDVVCSSDTVSALGFTISCQKFIAHLADSYVQSGEIAQRLSESKDRLQGGPAELVHLMTFEAKDGPQVVWTSGDVRVSAIRSTHIAGHASYRVDTPAGSVVIGGDAGNDKVDPPRPSSTSEEVEKLAFGADVIVHSTIHPVLGPDSTSGFPPLLFYRQSAASDLGAMAKRARARYLILTHLIPPLGAEHQGPWKIPGGALTEADYRKAVETGGFTGTTIVGTDLASLRLPQK